MRKHAQKGETSGFQEQPLTQSSQQVCFLESKRNLDNTVERECVASTPFPRQLSNVSVTAQTTQKVDTTPIYQCKPATPVVFFI